MNTTMPRRLLSLSILAATLGLSTAASAQDPAPSPSPEASPVVVVEAEPRIEAQVDAAMIEATVEAAVAASQAALVRDVRRSVKIDAAQRKAIARSARGAAEVEVARAMAMADAEGTRVIARAEAEAAMEAAMSEAYAAREAAREEAWQDAQDKTQEQKEKELEARERAREKERVARELAREKQEEAREREREARELAREKAREAREREQEKREAAREAADRDDELYDEAMSSIDDEEWNDALRPLNKLISLNMKVDAALYWKAYSQAKMNQTASVLASLSKLQTDFPQSRWTREGKALEMEVRGKAGQAPRPDQEENDDLKLMAVSALAQTDPQEAMPVLTKLLASPTASRRVKERALFVLAQIGSEQAGNAIADVARGNSSPELQRKAIQYLGVFGAPANRKVLSDIYASTTDTALRKQILNSFMVAGDKARVLNAAKTEKDPALRSTAVRLLGVMGGTAELSQMYSTATTAEEKKNILQALFVGGAIEPVAAAAKGEKDKEVRLVAVRNLGLMGRKSQDVLAELYRVETDPEVKKEVLNAFFLQGNATRLVEIARVEKDPALKKDAVHWLSLMNSKESRAFMLELLKD